LNSVSCDGFERDIAGIPYIRSFSDRIAVFIDEYQDFSEQQMLLMSSRAKAKYRQITAAGDASQRLHQVGISDVTRAFPRASEVRQIYLTENFRQTEPLARFSRRIRLFTEGEVAIGDVEPCRAPLHTFENRQEFADLASSHIADLPEGATVAVISPTRAESQRWFDVMAPSLQSAFRNPILSDRARLTERFRTHFATPLEVKGLEFDAVVIPDISSFSEADQIAMNGLYVAISRPRHALLVGCARTGLESPMIKDLRESNDLVLQPDRQPIGKKKPAVAG
jgi:DNA helicase IV